MNNNTNNNLQIENNSNLQTQIDNNSMNFEELQNNLNGFSQLNKNQNNFQQNIFQPVQQTIFNPEQFTNINVNIAPETSNSLNIIPQNADLSLPIVSVIVTVCHGSSYDPLFQSVKQKAPEGRVSVYSLNSALTGIFLLALENKDYKTPNETFSKNMKILIQEMSDVEPDCIVFNWECCSGCSEQGFTNKSGDLSLIKFLIEKGCMIMFSDFAVKAIIKDWNVEFFGPNPFIQLGVCSNQIELTFKPEDLLESPSSQLKMVSQLCEKGTAVIHALGGTIVFGVDRTKAVNDLFDVKVLTVATISQGFSSGDKSFFTNIGDKKGTIGHALVKYKSGGSMLLSAGHWVELSKIDVSLESLEIVANTIYKDNVEYKKEIQSMKMESMSNEERSTRVNRMANQFVQQSAPCNYNNNVNWNVKNNNNK